LLRSRSSPSQQFATRMLGDKDIASPASETVLNHRERQLMQELRGAGG
jgi:hypothetical protein